MANSPSNAATCANCGSPVGAEGAASCPSCGSNARVFRMAVEGTLRPRGELRYKGKEEGKSKPFVKGVTGASYSVRAKRWVRRVMRIDRRNDRYFEKVLDPETGQVIHEQEESIRAHQGHGSAKRNT